MSSLSWDMQRNWNIDSVNSDESCSLYAYPPMTPDCDHVADIYYLKFNKIHLTLIGIFPNLKFKKCLVLAAMQWCNAVMQYSRPYWWKLRYFLFLVRLKYLNINLKVTLKSVIQIAAFLYSTNSTKCSTSNPTNEINKSSFESTVSRLQKYQQLHNIKIPGHLNWTLSKSGH